MAAVMHTRAPFSARKCSKASSAGRRTVAVTCATAKGNSLVESAQIAAATVATLALCFTATPVEAKVILAKPELKKALFDDAPPAPPAPKKEIRLPGQSSSAPAAAKPKQESSGSVGGDIDPRAVALPGALLVTGAGAFAVTQLDKAFDWNSAFAKDSAALGMGYEAILKEGGLEAAFRQAGKTQGTGTKKVKAKGKSVFGK